MENLESWLRSKNMTTNEFAEIIQCSRQVLWKVKRNIPIDPKIALRISEATGSVIRPDSNPVGGQIRL